MNSEFIGWRQRPTHSYTLPVQVLEVPLGVIERTLKLFAPYAERGLEACCFWYGREAEPISRVAGIVVPAQRNTWGNYSIAAGAMATASGATRHKGWLNLAQIHTHPSSMVEHSQYDDDHVNSRRALSLVFPHYGHWQEAWPEGVGVHEYQDGWHLLEARDAGSRVQVVDGGDAEVVDLRG